MALELMKLTSKVLSGISNSSSGLNDEGSPTGVLDNKSAQVFCVPGIYSIWQLFPEIPKAHSWIFLFFIGASSRYFSGLWSVRMTNLELCR